MKFVTLALALLLAVGSQAASLQADAPSQLAQIRAAVDVYLTQVKESAKKALDGLDGTEYSDMKPVIASRLDEMYQQLKTAQAAVSPMTDNVVTTISDATADLRSSLMSDIEALKAELEPKRLALEQVLDKHVQEYKAQLEPVMKEYYAKHEAEMEALRDKMKPVMESLREKVAVNVEETKNALVPIVEAVRAKVTERLESLKETLKPYVEEYKEQFRQGYNHAQGLTAEQLTDLKNKITPMAEDIKRNIQAIAGVVVETFQH